MSSGLQSTLELLVLNNYISLAGVTLVVYDYILTFSREIEYIWCRPWTWVSTMFVLVRYIGLCWIMTNSLYGSSFVAGPLEAYVFLILRKPGIYNAWIDVAGWAFIVFLSATDLMMILRVYAMWNRSRPILSILLFLFVMQTISSIVLDAIYNNSDTSLGVSVTVARLLDYSFCNFSINTPTTLEVYRAALRLLLGAGLAILAVSQTLKQSFEMYRATKQWQPNRYMQKLVGDGILYFFVNVLYQIDYVLGFVATPTNKFVFFLSVFIYVAFYILIPRFMISIRELYDDDIHGRCHIDTGFGVQSRPNTGPDIIVSGPGMVLFADENQVPEVEGGTTNSGDLELGRVHGSGWNKDSPVGSRE